MSKRFGTIYADPPWQYNDQNTRAATSNHYSGMAVAEIRAMPVRELAADDAHLHLWTTSSFLPDAFRVIEAWGFEYRSILTWNKPQLGIGHYWRMSSEFLLLGIRGKAKRFADKALMSWLVHPRGEHSAKPPQVREMIERASPGPWLELFARQPAVRAAGAAPVLPVWPPLGWTVWGNNAGAANDTEVDAILNPRPVRRRD
jgi:N6-adenosine-specific RNA methylase IME4